MLMKSTGESWWIFYVEGDWIMDIVGILQVGWYNDYVTFRLFLIKERGD